MMKQLYTSILLFILFIINWNDLIANTISQNNTDSENMQTAAFGSLGNGRFRNPVIPSDYSDPDVIRVGNDYYGIASTFCFSPGMIVIHSKDLINWEIINHVVDDISFLHPDLDGKAMNGYYNGIWAGSLRQHDGLFYCHFCTPKGGWFVATTDDLYGKWNVEVMKDSNGRELRGGGWDDVCPLWDTDGNAYIVASNFGKHWFPHIFKMSQDGKYLLDAVVDDKCNMEKNIELIGGYVVKPFRTAEAGKLYKFGDTYYIYFSEVRNIHGNDVRVPVMRRSKSIYGPYEEHLLLHSQGKRVDKEPNQGAIVDAPDGRWWFVTHHGTGDFDGRVVSVLPVEWNEGWPEIGVDLDEDGVGEMVWEMENPIEPVGNERILTSDDFIGEKLGVQWEFNHQPDNEKWTLSQRPGFFRLYSSAMSRDGDFFSVPNILSQRYIRWGKGEILIKMDISHMENDQEGGLAFFNGGKDYSYLAIKKTTNGFIVVFSDKQVGKPEKSCIVATESRNCRNIWIKAIIGFDGKGEFSWSMNGKKFHEVRERFQLKWGSYRGARIGLFTFDNKKGRGYVDFDSFIYKEVKSED